VAIWGLTAGTLAAVAAIMAAAGFVQAAAGFGLALLAVPLMSLLVAPQVAVVVVFLHSAGMSLYLASRNRAHIEWADARRLTVGAVLAMPLGVVLLVEGSASLLRLLLGAVTIAAALWLMAARPHQRPARAFAPGATYAVGAASGVLNTALSTNGPPLVAYLSARGIPQSAFRATISFVFVVSSVVGLVMLLAGGAVHPLAVKIYLVTLPVAAVGFLLGNTVAPRLRREHFARLVDVMLLAGGVLALVKAVTG
jgi:uncharacterized membrane protein YfcA